MGVYGYGYGYNVGTGRFELTPCLENLIQQLSDTYEGVDGKWYSRDISGDREGDVLNGSYLKMDGVSNYASINSDIGVEYSIKLEVIIDNYINGDCILSKGGELSKPNLVLDFTFTDLRAFFYPNDNSSPVIISAPFSTSSELCTIEVIKNSTSFSLIVNDVIVASTVTTKIPFNNSNQIYIASRSLSSFFAFDIMFLDLGIARYYFDEKNGIDIFNSLGNECHGTINDVSMRQEGLYDTLSNVNGYTDNSGQIIPANINNLTLDVLDNPLQYVGKVKIHALLQEVGYDRPKHLLDGFDLWVNSSNDRLNYDKDTVYSDINSRPVGWGWVDGVTITESEGVFSTDFDILTKKNIPTATKRVGLSVDADFSTITQAISWLSANPQSDYEIQIEAGVYYQGYNVLTHATNYNFVAIGGRVILTNNYLEGFAPVFSDVGSNTYVATIVNAVHVFDSSVIDENGDYLRLDKETSIANCQANSNSYYINGDDIYIHLYDNRNIDSSVKIYTGIYGIRPRAAQNYYFEGIDFEGSVSGIYTDTIEAHINANSCTFKYGTTNAITISNDVDNYFYRCIASFAQWDGFNYHEETLGLGCKVFENECIGRNNGWNGGTSHNGSTIHGSGRIIRLNCEYKNNLRNIHDINDAQSIMYGCIANTSRGILQNEEDSVNLRCGAYTNTTLMWVYGGDFTGGAYSDITVDSGATLVVDGTTINLLEHKLNVIGTLNNFGIPNGYFYQGFYEGIGEGGTGLNMSNTTVRLEFYGDLTAIDLLNHEEFGVRIFFTIKKEGDSIIKLDNITTYDPNKAPISGDCRKKTGKYVGLTTYPVTEGNYQVTEGDYLILKG